MSDLAYPTLVWAHLLLFVLWLGADVGVFVLGQHFRRRNSYSLDQRIALLKLLVEVDMKRRTAIAAAPLLLGANWAAAAASAPAAAAGDGKVLRYAFVAAETGFDPAKISDLYSRICTSHMCRTRSFR